MSGWHRRFRWRLTLVAGLALAARIAYVLTVARRNPDGGDPLFYHLQANLLADGHGFSEPFGWLEDGRLEPTAIHPPLFSLALATASVVGAGTFLAHKVVACAIGAATVAVVGLVGREVAGERAGLAAATVAAVYPNLWMIDGILMPESLFALTIAAVLHAAVRLRRSRTVVGAALLGGAIGLAALTRAEAILLLPLLAVPLAVVAGGSWRERMALAAVAGAVAATVVAPWSIRNAVRFERPVPLSTNGEEVLAYANCDRTYYGDKLGSWSVLCHEGAPRGDESQRARYWRDQGLDYLGDHLDRFPVVAAARLGRVFDVYEPFHNTRVATIEEGKDLTVARAGLFAYWAAIPLAGVGAVVARRRGTPLLPFAAQVVLVMVTAVYAYGTTRFRTPAEVAIVVLAGVALASIPLGGRGGRRRWRR